MSVYLNSRQERRIFSPIAGIMYKGKDYSPIFNMYSTCYGPN